VLAERDYSPPTRNVKQIVKFYKYTKQNILDCEVSVSVNP